MSLALARLASYAVNMEMIERLGIVLLAFAYGEVLRFTVTAAVVQTVKAFGK